MAMGILSLLASVVLPLAVLRHLAALMRRVPRAGLVRFARIEFWLGLIAGALFVAGYVASIVISFWSIAPLPFSGPTGPNAAAFGYAAAPNSPPTGAPNAPPRFDPNAINYSDPNLAFNTDPNTGAMTVTYTTSAGEKVTRTITSTTTAGPYYAAPPRYSAALTVAGLIVAVSGFTLISIIIAVVVLLVMANRALSAAAREAEAGAKLTDGSQQSGG
jgi:hypothetical protein